MIWDEIRAQYPHQWLLVEAKRAHTDQGQRIIDEPVVIAQVADGLDGWRVYGTLHREDPHRELYVVHTDRPQLDIQERVEPVLRGVRAR